MLVAGQETKLLEDVMSWQSSMLLCKFQVKQSFFEVAKKLFYMEIKDF